MLVVCNTTFINEKKLKLVCVLYHTFVMLLLEVFQSNKLLSDLQYYSASSSGRHDWRVKLMTSFTIRTNVQYSRGVKRQMTMGRPRQLFFLYKISRPTTTSVSSTRLQRRMVASLKEEKEAFVTGHTGSTPWEVLLVCSSAPVGFAFYQILSANVKQTMWRSILYEALTLWLPMVVCQTNLLYPWGVAIIAVQLLCIIFMACGISLQPRHGSEQPQTTTASGQHQRIDYLTIYRSSILYLTFVAILAVDFHVFPRRFAKTEVSGYGLMDVGAASFVLSAGFVSSKARRRSPDAPTSYNIRRYALHTLPLVAIGFIRFITNKGLDYQEHVSEYGVHWNFFFTLGVMAFITPLVPLRTPTWYLPVLLLTLYQICLGKLGWQEYIETAPRTCNDYFTTQPISRMFCDIIAANREGILGCVGYFTINLLGEFIGFSFLWNKGSASLQGGGTTLYSKGLFLLSGILWVIHWILVHFLNIPVSRRSTNASFCVWVVAHNVLLLAMIQAGTSLGKQLQHQKGRQLNLPPVMEKVNRYGLIMFLVANLLTGLVNLTVPTLRIGDTVAFLIVFGYICAISIAALLVDLVYQKFTPLKWKKKSE